MWGEDRKEMSQGRMQRRGAWGSFLSCQRQQHAKEIPGKEERGRRLMGLPIITHAEILVEFFGCLKAL